MQNTGRRCFLPTLIMEESVLKALGVCAVCALGSNPVRSIRSVASATEHLQREFVVLCTSFSTAACSGTTAEILSLTCGMCFVVSAAKTV